MTHVSTPNVGALPRQRTPKLGSIGAIALVVAVGAAIAGGIAVTTDEAPAANEVGNTFTQQREGQANPVPADRADTFYLNLGAERSAGADLRTGGGYAENTGQPR